MFPRHWKMAWLPEPKLQTSGEGSRIHLKPFSPTADPLASLNAVRPSCSKRISFLSLREFLSDVYDLDQFHIQLKVVMTPRYRRQFRIQRHRYQNLVISRIEIKHMIYKHTSSLPIVYTYVMPLSLTYRASRNCLTTMRNYSNGYIMYISCRI